MRRPRVVASVALIAALVAVAVPRAVGSRSPSFAFRPDPGLFQEVEGAVAFRGAATTISPLDPGARSAGAMDLDQILIEPTTRSESVKARPRAAQPQARAGSVLKNPWRSDREISWYGPGFYGQGTACGQTLTKGLVGVAHRTLPCGTRVTFRSNGHTVTVPVVDRGPYVGGRQFDLTTGACKLLAHCYTGPIQWRLAG
ncbi:MAG: septal ring lytic transglycosylase RlpA family protein [Chloroflexota bacterium]